MDNFDETSRSAEIANCPGHACRIERTIRAVLVIRRLREDSPFQKFAQSGNRQLETDPQFLGNHYLLAFSRPVPVNCPTLHNYRSRQTYSPARYSSGVKTGIPLTGKSFLFLVMRTSAPTRAAE